MNAYKSLIQLHRQLLLSSCKDFTCKMFEYLNKKPYIVGRHHELIFRALDKVIKGNTRKLIINIAPRYGKTLLCSQMFVAYGMALNPSAKFLHLSYSGDLTQENSLAVKDIITSEYFRTLFPDVQLRQGMNTRSKWSTTADGGLYATSTLGQITGFGAGKTERENEDEESIDEFTARYNPNRFGGAIVIDDPIKPEDALSETMRESVNRRFETTIRNRVNSRKTPIIIIMQRLHEHDLCGYLQEIEPNEWEVLSIPCIQYDKDGKEKALWEYKHTLDELHKIEKASEFVFQTQYMQNPTPLEGLLYREFATYEDISLLPKDNRGRNCIYVDSADKGEDYLCAIAYVERPEGNYITDVLFTKKPMEYTEPSLVKMIHNNSTRFCYIESNNGGRIFRRNVERICRETGQYKVQFVDVTQTENKQIRLFTKANEVNNLTLFPKNWERLWVDFANQIKYFRKEGRNQHDDAPDALTGTIEMRDKSKIDSKRMAEIFGL